MKRRATGVLGFAGFCYGLLAVLMVYRDAPFTLQAFIVMGVTAVGAAAGWLLGVMANLGAGDGTD